MPWSNQGGGPWGGGEAAPRGPWGSGPQSSGPTPPDLEDLLRRSQDKLKSVLPGGSLGGRGVMLIVLARRRRVGLLGLLPGRAGRTRRGAALRQVHARRQAGPELSPALSDRDGAHPEGHARQPHRHRHAADRGPAPRRHDDARRAGGKPDAHRRREHRRRRRVGVLAGQDRRRRRLPVQHPEPGRDREGGGRERDARGDRPLRDPADPDRRAAEHRDRGARADAEGARQLSGRRAGHAGADAEGRSARAGDRQLPRRAGRARRPRARAERRRRPTPIAWFRKPAARRRRSSRSAEAYREQTVAEAKGQAARFSQVYEQYKKAPAVTRQRIYLETMERVFGGTDKILLDSNQQGSGGNAGGVVPILPLNELLRRAPTTGGTQ